MRVADGQATVGVKEVQVGSVHAELDRASGRDPAARADPCGPQGLSFGERDRRVVRLRAAGESRSVFVLDWGRTDREDHVDLGAEWLGDVGDRGHPRPAGMGRVCPANDAVACSAPPFRRAVTRFMAGEPMNPATNRLTGRSNRFCGVSTCCSKPSRSTHTRSPSVIASIWSWVTYTVVTFSRSCSWASDARMLTRSLASRLESGSSIKNACGSRTIARPIATRCRCPPDSAAGLRDRY